MKTVPINKRLVLAVLLTLILALIPFSAYAAENEEAPLETVSVTADGILQSGGIPENPSARFGTATLEEMTRDDVLYSTILNGLRECSSEISLSPITDNGFAEYNYYTDEDKAAITEVFSLVINRNPEFFYVSNSFSLSIYSDGDIATVNPQYLYEGDSLTAVQNEFASLVDEICAHVPNTLSDYEKVLLIHDYFVANYSYDTRIYDSSASAEANFDAYSFLKEKTAVCEGYTLAMIAVMDKLGIECDAATSRDMNHTWNYIKLGENWYHLDITHDDPVTDIPGRVSHRKFLRSDDGMTSLGASGWTSLYECSETSYDTAADGLTTVSPYVYYNGAWYTTSFYNYSGRLNRHENADIREIYGKLANGSEIGTEVHNIGRWTVASGGFFPSSYSYPLVYGDYLLFNAPQALCVYDGTSVSTVKTFSLETGTNVYGLNINGDTLTYMFSTSPNEEEVKAATTDTTTLNIANYYDYDGVSLLGSVLYGDGSPFTSLPSNPTRAADEYYEYTFAGWVESGSDYVASYSKTALNDYTVIDGALVENSVNDEKVRIPDGVEKICKDAFANTADVKYVVLPSTVTQVEEGAFAGITCTVYLTVDNESVKNTLASDGVSYKLIGDIDGSGSVDFDDVSALGEKFAWSVTVDDEICADTNADDKVSLADLSKLAVKFFKLYA